MTRRERFERTMKKLPVDRVVRDLAGTPQTGIEANVTEGLKKLLGIEGEYTGPYSAYDERILEALDIDIRKVGTLFEPESPNTKMIGKRAYDCWGVGREFTGMYWDIVENPLRGCDMETVKTFPFPDASGIDKRQIEQFKEEAKRLYYDTDYVVCAEHPTYGVMEIGCWMMGFDDYFLKLALEPELIECFSNRVKKYQQDVFELYYGALGDYIHFTTCGDDYGTQNGPFLSKDMFDEMILPYIKWRVKYIKSMTKGYFWQHSCGSVYSVIPSLIEAGVDILNPIQPGAKDMEPEKLKAAYGDKMVFWGGIDTQHLLVEGTPEQVKEEVRRVIKAMNGTGYVLAAAHNIQSDVPAENVLALYQA